MAYIGNNTDHNAEVFKTTKDRFSGNASTTAFTLSAVPANAESMQVFVNNVRQDSGQAYTVSGTTLTFTSAPSNATGNIYVVFNSVIAGISQVITANTQLRTGVVTTHSIIDDAISETKLKISNSTTNGYVLTANTSASGGLTWQPTASSYTHPNHSGEVTSTADGAQVIADNVVDEANLKISNTPTNGYMLTAQSGNAGGLTWAAAGGGATEINGLSDALVENNSIFLGNDPSGTTSSALNNVAVGKTALDSITTGDSNAVVGYNSATALTTGEFNTAMGNASLLRLTTGSVNVAIGSEAGQKITTGYGNVCVGDGAGYDITTGLKNTMIGRYSGHTGSDFTGSNNIIIGYMADASSQTVSNEITLGANDQTKFRVPGVNFVVKSSTATDNYVLTVDSSGEAGWEAAAGGATDIDGLSDAKSIDRFSVGLGTNALRVGQATKYNTALGNDAGYSVTSGTENIFMGNAAGYSSTYGAGNVFLGASSGYRVTTGSSNTYVGTEAGKGHHVSVPTGSNNTSLGYYTLRAISGGAAQNTAIGKDAGLAVTTGSNNTFLGYDAGDATTTSTNNTIIGNEADASSATVSNEITLGNTSITKFRIPGLNFDINATGVGIGTTAPTQKIQGVIGTTGGFPATSGTTQSHSILRLNTSNAGTCLDFGVDGATTAASWIQATAQNNLATNWTLALNPNGGKVGIGTTAPASRLHIDTSGASYSILQITNGTSGSAVTDGLHIGLDPDGTAAFNIRDASENMVFRTQDSPRMTLLAAGGLTFGSDTAAANALDDYEEGTWTPGITGTSSGGTGKTMGGNNYGYYTKVGNLCTISGTISVSGSETIAGSVAVTGLPFAAHGGADGRASGSTGANQVFTCAADYRLAFVVDPSQQKIWVIAQRDEATVTYNHTPAVGTGNVFGFSVTYRTA